MTIFHIPIFINLCKQTDVKFCFKTQLDVALRLNKKMHETLRKTIKMIHK